MRYKIKIVFCCIIGIFIILLFGNIFLNSPVQSEDAHFISGISHWKFKTFDLYRVNPPFVRSVVTLPQYLVSDNIYDWKNNTEYFLLRNEHQVGEDFLKANGNNVYKSIYSARLYAIVFALLGSCICFYFSRKMYLSIGIGIIAIVLWCFNPYLLGHGATIMPDAHGAVFALMSVYCYWQWLKNSYSINAFFAGLVLGIAELCKFTLLIFYPLFVLLWILYRLREQPKLSLNHWTKQSGQIMIIFAVSVLVINMGYLFENSGKPLRTFRFQTALFTGSNSLKEVPAGGGNRFDGSGNIFETAVGYLPMPLPANFIQGIDTQRLDFEKGLSSYLRGEWSDHGWWYYYLYALLIKTPIGTILIFLLAIFCTLFLKGYNAPWRDEMTLLLPGIALVAFVSSQSGFSVHSRYVIPALPFFFVWMSKVGRSFTGIPEEKRYEQNQSKQEHDKLKVVTKYPQGYKTVRVLTVIFFAWSILSSLLIYPHSISYFNELAVLIPTPKTDEHPQKPPIQKPTGLYDWYKAIVSAGPRNGPRHLLDSNIDWGQDLFNLERWCKRHPEVTDLKLLYWGSYPDDLTSIPTKGYPPLKNPKPGWYAISVNHIYSRDGKYRYFLDYAPVAMAGYSIYIYHITQADIDRVKDRVKDHVKDSTATIINGKTNSGVTIKQEEANP